MAVKFKLEANPTFKAKVLIPVPGAPATPVEFIFKHRGRDAFNQFLEGIGKYEDDVAVAMDIATGWELEEPFDQANLQKLDQNYIGALRAVLDVYLRENGQARLGN
ncbi:MAG: phage tail assembly chaperone [Ramlibacter sp.]